MADDRTLAPSPARRARAWRAGQRPWSPWLWPAALCGGLALGLDASARTWGAPRGVGPGAVAPERWLMRAAEALAIGWVVAALVLVAVGLVSRRLGAVSSIDARRLRVAAARPEVWGRAALGLLLAVGLLLALLGVVAGAARAVDASEAGLGALWLGWATRASAALAVALGLAAAVDLGLDRGDRLARLFLSRQQQRDEARDRGGAAR